MCQQSPGPRCWKDTSARHAKLEARLSKVEGELETATSDLNQATANKDYAKYEKARAKTNSLKDKVRTLRSEVSLNQRDMDGTRTGQKRLEQSIMESDSPSERKILQERMATGAALAEARKRALELKKSKAIPLFRIQNSKKESAMA